MWSPCIMSSFMPRAPLKLQRERRQVSCSLTHRWCGGRAVVSHLIWVLGVELGFSIRATCVLSLRVMSPAPERSNKIHLEPHWMCYVSEPPSPNKVSVCTDPIPLLALGPHINPSFRERTGTSVSGWSHCTVKRLGMWDVFTSEGILTEPLYHVP
jgi:hypothetical protein